MAGAIVITSASASSSHVFMDFPSILTSRTVKPRSKRLSQPSTRTNIPTPLYVIPDAFTCFPKLPMELRLKIW